MARHNREGKGTDQRGFTYRVSYQPDWLRRVKITRCLPTGRQSTKTLVRNPERSRRPTGPRVRTRITCPEQGLDVEVAVRGESTRKLAVRCAVREPGGHGEEEIVFTLERRPTE